jgi:hypothetical protein
MLERLKRGYGQALERDWREAGLRDRDARRRSRIRRLTFGLLPR